MSTPSERTISGRMLVVVGLIVAAVVTLASIVWGPALREEVRQEDSPRTLREPIASGEYQGQVWEAVGRFNGQANCVELRYRGAVVDSACDDQPQSKQTQLPPEGPVIAYGVAAEDRSSVTVTLDDDTSVQAPAVAGELGFPVSFWAVELPPGRSVQQADTG